MKRLMWFLVTMACLYLLPLGILMRDRTLMGGRFKINTDLL